MNVNEHVKTEQIKRNVTKQSQIFGKIVFAVRKSKTNCIKKGSLKSGLQYLVDSDWYNQDFRTHQYNSL